MGTVMELLEHDARAAFREGMYGRIIDQAVGESPALLDEHPEIQAHVSQFKQNVLALTDSYDFETDTYPEDRESINERIARNLQALFGSKPEGSGGLLQSAGLVMVVIVPEGLEVYRRLPEADHHEYNGRTIRYAGGIYYGRYAYAIRGLDPELNTNHIATFSGTVIPIDGLSRYLRGDYTDVPPPSIIVARHEIANCFDDEHIDRFHNPPSAYREPSTRTGNCGTCTVETCRHGRAQKRIDEIHAEKWGEGVFIF